MDYFTYASSTSVNLSLQPIAQISALRTNKFSLKCDRLATGINSAINKMIAQIRCPSGMITELAKLKALFQEAIGFVWECSKIIKLLAYDYGFA